MTSKPAAALTVVVALIAFLVGVRKGTFVPADTDPYGYVSQADAIAGGSLRVDQRFALSMPWDGAESSFVPPGYDLATVPGFIVPKYSAGLPMVMAAFERVSGRRAAVFYVVPLLGAIAVWMTGRLGARVHSPLAGVIAGALLAASPIFVFQIVQPVSDVPVAAWWTVALALAVRRGAWSALGAGLAASMAILTRPNLAPLAAVLGAFFAWPLVRPADENRREALRLFVLYVIALLPGCLAVAALNHHFHGSVLRSGYGPLEEIYQWERVLPNLDRYPRWLVETQSPLVCLALAAPWVATSGQRRDRTAPRADHVWLLLAFSAGVFLSYLFWGVFERDNWNYLRFLLPIYPPLLVLSVVVVIEAARRIASRRHVDLLAVILISAAAAWWETTFTIDHHVLDLQLAERRYKDVGQYIAAAMPHDAIFVAGLHSGTIRYYSNRLTVNYNRMDPTSLDEAIAALRAHGYHPYLALEEGERPSFAARFDSHSELSRLDWPAAAEGSNVQIWDPLDRTRFLSGTGVVTGDINWIQKPRVTWK